MIIRNMIVWNYRSLKVCFGSEVFISAVVSSISDAAADVEGKLFNSSKNLSISFNVSSSNIRGLVLGDLISGNILRINSQYSLSKFWSDMFPTRLAWKLGPASICDRSGSRIVFVHATRVWTSCILNVGALIILYVSARVRCVYGTYCFLVSNKTVWVSQYLRVSSVLFVYSPTCRIFLFVIMSNI